MGNFLRYVTGRSGVASLGSRLIHSPQSLRVLMYHDVPESRFGHFKSHLAWDNYELVAPLLESYDARGLFFVCPGFAGLEREESFRLMERSAAVLGETNRDSRWQRLSRAQIVELDRRGHGIGSHTLTHAPLAHISEADATHEVKQSAALLASWLGHDCHFFAWTYSWDEITPHSLKIAEGHHRFCFSPCGGLNLWPRPPRLLARTSVDVSKPVPYLQTQLSGLQEWVYKSKQEWLWRLWSSVNGA